VPVRQHAAQWHVDPHKVGVIGVDRQFVRQAADEYASALFRTLESDVQ
jgi:hypothetical protein